MSTPLLIARTPDTELFLLPHGQPSRTDYRRDRDR